MHIVLAYRDQATGEPGTFAARLEPRGVVLLDVTLPESAPLRSLIVRAWPQGGRAPPLGQGPFAPLRWVALYYWTLQVPGLFEGAPDVLDLVDVPDGVGAAWARATRRPPHHA